MIASTESPHSDWDPDAPGVLQDVPASLAELRDHCPVPYARSDGGYYAFTRYADIVAATRDPHTFSSAAAELLPNLRRIPIELDPPEHTLYRRILQPYFSTTRLQALEDRVRHFAADLLQPLIDAGGGDLARAFTFPFPTRVLCATLNIPDEDWAKLKLWAGEGRSRRPGARGEGNAAFVVYARDMVAARRRAPLDPDQDITTGLLDARIDGEPLSDDRIVGILRLLLSAGHSSTTISLGILIHCLATHPELQSELRAAPGLVPKAIEEILRHETPVVANANPRVLTRDVDVAGRSLKAGDRIVLLWGSGNRDEGAFPDADRCVINRSPNRHLVFGQGVHMCIGAPVARQEMRIALEELLARTDSFALAGSVERGTWWRQRGPIALPISMTQAAVYV